MSEIKYKKGDKVYHPCDAAPFTVLAVRKDRVKIEGDWSGGTHNICQADWVKKEDIKPYDVFKVTYYFNGLPYKMVRQVKTL